MIIIITTTAITITIIAIIHPNISRYNIQILLSCIQSFPIHTNIDVYMRPLPYLWVVLEKQLQASVDVGHQGHGRPIIRAQHPIVDPFRHIHAPA